MNKINLPKLLLAVFAGLWLILAIKPVYRFDWFLENIVIFLSLPVVIWSYFKFRLSIFSYFLIFIFAVFHIAAAHYTYGDTPWGDWLSSVFNLERNNFDRIVHFLYGFFMAPILADAFGKYLPQGRYMKNFIIFSVIVSFGALYEVAEYVVGVLVEPEAGLAFLGFQGDIWDTQKDMGLQALGASLGLFIFRKKISEVKND